jgi:hypothetical protein
MLPVTPRPHEPRRMRLQRATIDLSFVSARTVGREALESSSADFQTAARPSQLPTRVAFGHEKSPMSLWHRALRSSVRFLGRASTAQRMRGQFIRRLTGDATFGSLFVRRIYPQSQHCRFPRFVLTQLLPRWEADLLDGPYPQKVRQEFGPLKLFDAQASGIIPSCLNA